MIGSTSHPIGIPARRSNCRCDANCTLVNRTASSKNDLEEIPEVLVLYLERPRATVQVLVLYLERPRAAVRVRMCFGRALLIQRLEGSRPQGSLCTLNGAGSDR